MDAQFADILREIEDTSRLQGGFPLMAREAGHFLNLLVKIRQARSVLEVGTGDGYMTLWLAEAVAANEGSLTTIEGDVWQTEVARSVIARSPHTECIRFLEGDPIELLPVVEGPFDLVILGANKSQSLVYLRMLTEKLHSGAVVCCEQAMSMAGALADYLTYVHESPGLESLLVPINEGIEVTYKVP